MEPKKQIEMIVDLLAPDSDTRDAVWLVQRLITESNRRNMDLHRANAKLEAELKEAKRAIERLRTTDEDTE